MTTARVRCDQRAKGGQCVLGRGHRLDSEHHWNGEKEWPCFENGPGYRRQTSTHSSEMAIDAKRGTCPKCFASPDVDLHDTFRCSHGLRPARREEFVPTPAPAPAKPDTFNVGDYVRWWPTPGSPWGDLTIDGEAYHMHDGKVTALMVKAHSPHRLGVSGPSVGYVYDVTSAPGKVVRIQRPVVGDVTSTFENAVTSPVVTREPAPPDPLDVEYDGVKLQQLLDCDQDNRRFESPVGFTPAQRAAVSAHWSAQLRAKVDASAAAERERERNRVVLDQDADDMTWRTW